MSSAAERAEARRRAILSRGSDRLSKLTTSARGEGAPGYLSDSPRSMSSTLRSFVGEESEMPTPSPQMRRVSLSPSPSPAPATPPTHLNRGQNRSTSETFASLLSQNSPDPSVWTEEQQRDFLNALMSGGPQSRPLPGMQSQLQQRRASTEPPTSAPQVPMDNPLAALLSQQPPGFAPGPSVAAPPAQPPTRLQKIMPLLHLASMWALLVYFVFYREPSAYQGSIQGMCPRWGQLASNLPMLHRGFVIEPVPFFWAFTTLEIVLHSVRIFSGFNAVQPPTLLALALPHLPAPLPSIIINTMKYFQMASLFLNDVAALVFGIGFMIVYARWNCVPSI